MTKKITRDANKEIGLLVLSSMGLGAKKKPQIAPLKQLIPNKGGQTELLSLCLDTNTPSSEKPRVVWGRGGIGSGKSTIGAYALCERLRIDNQQGALITANDYPQLSRSTLVILAEVCQAYGIPLDPMETNPKETARRIAHRGFCKIWDAFVYVVSANNFSSKVQSARGIQLRTFWADELAYSPDAQAIETLMGRLGRGSGRIDPLGIITSSINRNNPYNWIYELFDSPDRSIEMRKDYQSVKMTAYENPYLPSGYIESLKAIYSDELIKIEIEGEYASTTEGQIFRYFNRENHRLKCLPTFTGGVYVSFDFNWNPACAIIGQIDGQNIRVVKEFYIPNADTFVLADQVCQWIVTHRFNEARVFGDASGIQQTANSHQTNWQIVFDSLRRYGVTAFPYIPAKNPLIIDSVNSVNSLFKQDRLLIDDNCSELIKDLESLQWKEQGRINKKDLARSHLADCLRYLVHTIYPFNPLFLGKQDIKQGTYVV